jgi:hypothetical protein
LQRSDPDHSVGNYRWDKTMSDADVEPGPVDYVVAAFPLGQANVSGEMASEPAALLQSNTVRMLDLLLLTNNVDGLVQPLTCARRSTARSFSSPAFLGTWKRIGDCTRANIRCPSCRSTYGRRNARWMRPAVRVRERESATREVIT